MTGTRGFTLVEVVVALVILEVGLLGVMATLVLAARTATRALTEERAAAEAAWVLDSLVEAGAQGSGSQPVAGGALRWSVSAEGWVEVAFLPGRGELGGAAAWRLVTRGGSR